jgi:DNA ligase 1
MKIFFLLIFFLSNMLSLNLEKPKIYHNQKINNWLMSEKLDGIRAYWDGKNLYTKNGNPIFTPKEFTNNFPSFELDGELWTKRDDFENIQNIVLDKSPSSKWNEISYNIFEAPNSKGNFYKRVEKIKIWFENNPNNNVNIIKQYLCKDEEDLDTFLEKIISLKGEGVIIKNPNLEYINKRSQNSLKVKKFYDDEGIIQKINYKNNQMKSLTIKLKNGTTFNLGNGFSDIQRVNPPKVGEQITFKYYGLTKNGKPKFASFLRVRNQE